MGYAPFFISKRENDIYAWVMSLSLFLKNKIYESLPIDHLVTWKSIENHTIESFCNCEYLYCHWKSIIKRFRIPLKMFNPATFVCLSQAITWMSIDICHSLFCIQ